MTADLSKAAILGHLSELIKLQSERVGDWPGKPADDTLDWLAINFLFRVGREYQRLSTPAREQLDVIFCAWTTPEPLSVAEFASMLETFGSWLLMSQCYRRELDLISPGPKTRGA
jgi:hypothetical protein